MVADTDTDGEVDEDRANNSACFYQDDSSHQNGVAQWCSAEYDIRFDFDFNSLTAGSQPFTFGLDVTATNSSPIEFYLRRPGSKGCPSTTESCLVNRPFRITYDDLLGQTWEVDVASMTWAP